jgi:hypothetical protein
MVESFDQSEDGMGMLLGGCLRLKTWPVDIVDGGEGKSNSVSAYVTIAYLYDHPSYTSHVAKISYNRVETR